MVIIHMHTCIFPVSGYTYLVIFSSDMSSSSEEMELSRLSKSLGSIATSLSCEGSCVS